MWGKSVPRVEDLTLSSVAPAAPSTSAPAAAQPSPGSVTEVTPTPTLAPISDAPADGPQSPLAKRSAKPIVPSLPGVFPDEDPFPSPPSRADAPTPAGKTRGPDGRFASGTSPEAGAGEHALEAADQPQPSRFKFAGEEYESQAAAEQNVRTLRGQFKPVQSLARSLGGVDKIVPQFQQAAESARGWKAEAEAVRAELEALRSGAQPATAPAATQEGAEEGIDWTLYAEIEKLAAESGEPWKARKWLAEQQEKVVNDRLQRALDERLRPLADAEAHAATVAQTETLFSSLAEYTNSDGSTAFPELHDERSAYEVGRLWQSLGLPAESALTQQGAIAAIAIYRMAKGNRSQAGVPQPTPAPHQRRLPAAPGPTDTLSAAVIDEGQVRTLSAPGGNAPSAEAQRILAGLRNTHQGNRAVLGFEP
jgi:hypothetical protein